MAASAAPERTVEGILRRRTQSAAADVVGVSSLITVICLALLIFCLIEREVWAALAPDTDMGGFYLNDGRLVKPTGRLILRALAGLRLVPGHRGQPPIIPQPTWVQAELLRLLQIDPTQPRWP